LRLDRAGAIQAALARPRRCPRHHRRRDLATFFLAEPIGLYHFVGGALILVGIHLANRTAA
jgi:drug/metabolite transporter (DMT)-like permease